VSHRPVFWYVHNPQPAVSVIVEQRFAQLLKEDAIADSLSTRASPSSCSPSTSNSAMQLLSESAEKVGYLLKDRIGDVSDFVDAVRRVANGGSAIDPGSSRRCCSGGVATIHWLG
jgi:hypothetical protein